MYIFLPGMDNSELVINLNIKGFFNDYTGFREILLPSIQLVQVFFCTFKLFRKFSCTLIKQTIHALRLTQLYNILFLHHY